jgi:hypothetical protein
MEMSPVSKEHLSKKEVLLDKLNEPTVELIKFCIGNQAYAWMGQLEEMLSERYDVKSELRFWDSWQKGYWHKKTWLFDIIFQEDGLEITLTITDKRVPHMEEIQHELQPRLQEVWKNRKKFGPSSWPMTFDVENEQDLTDLMKVLAVKLPPKK